MRLCASAEESALLFAMCGERRVPRALRGGGPVDALPLLLVVVALAVAVGGGLTQSRSPWQGQVWGRRAAKGSHTSVLDCFPFRNILNYYAQRYAPLL